MPATEQVRVERAVYGGFGLAHTAGGMAAFVPFTLPGELVEIRPSSRGEAALVQVVQPAAERTQPPCPHFGPCGGCHYQHATYPTQLEMKRSILLETMQRAMVNERPEVQVENAAAWEYRNRVRFRFAEVGGELRFGYNMRGTNEFLPVRVCPISAPMLVQAAESLITLARENHTAEALLRATRELEVFANEDGSRLSLTFLLSKSAPGGKDGLAKVCEAMQTTLPALVSAGTASADMGATARRFVAESWGAAGIAYQAAGESYWVSRGGFFQVNRFLLGRLVELVCERRSGGIAWDLFAGVGLFSRVLARSFAQVTAVEANPTAAADLRAALSKLGQQHMAVQASTLTFLQGALLQRERPDLVVLDPPRAGAGAQVCELLLRAGADEMVYVSCDPATLARDLQVLQRGYKIAAMHLIDLFPQTFHMETVVVLTKK